jgi:hypothetical protein
MGLADPPLCCGTMGVGALFYSYLTDDFDSLVVPNPLYLSD